MQTQGLLRKSIVAGLSVYAAFLLAALAWFVFYHFPGTSVDAARPAAADAAGPVDRYAGSVLMPIDADRRCRRMTFDNNTGGFQDNGISACRDDVPGKNSTEGRMNAIRNAFTGK